MSLAWGHKPEIPALGRLRKGDYEIESRWGCIARCKTLWRGAGAGAETGGGGSC